MSQTRGGHGSNEAAPDPFFAAIPVTRGGAEELPEGKHSLVQGFLTPGVPESHPNVQRSLKRVKVAVYGVQG